MALTLRIGGEQAEYTLLPVADGVRCQLIEIKENKFRSTAADFCFLLADPEYDGGSDDEVDAAIQAASVAGHKHFETCNIPDGPVGKGTKLFKLIKGMNGGRDIEEGEDVDLEPFVGEFYLIDFEHVQKQKPNDKGGFDKVYDDKGRPVYKAQAAKVRPEKKAKKDKPQRTVAAPPVAADDSDLFTSDDS